MQASCVARLYRRQRKAPIESGEVTLVQKFVDPEATLCIPCCRNSCGKRSHSPMISPACAHVIFLALARMITSRILIARPTAALG